MSIFSFVSGLELGIVFGILALGLYIAFRILDLPDLTVDGSFVTGIALCGVASVNGHYILGLFLALLGGAIAGATTGLIHTKLKVQPILAGIITMTALYSINLRINGLKPSVFFFNQKTIFSFLEGKLIINGYDYSKLLVLIIILILVAFILYMFLNTKTGLLLKATGDNPQMVISNNVSIDKMKIIGLMISNSLVAFSGGIYVQYSKQASQSIGTGMLVLGLASIIIGESIFRPKSTLQHIIAVSLGSIIYRLLLTVAFSIGLPPTDFKLFSALIVIFTIALPKISILLKRRNNYVVN